MGWLSVTSRLSFVWEHGGALAVERVSYSRKGILSLSTEVMSGCDTDAGTQGPATRAGRPFASTKERDYTSRVTGLRGSEMLHGGIYWKVIVWLFTHSTNVHLPSTMLTQPLTSQSWQWRPTSKHLE